MKTIFDAVNELEGSLSNGSGGYYAGDTYLFHALDGSHYITDDNRGDEGVYQYISTTKEFNALLEEMKLGLDINAITNDMFNSYTYSAKELLEPVGNIDWDNAPEYYDYYLEYIPNKTSNGFCCIDSGWGYAFLDGTHPTNIDDWKIIPRPIQSPVYTQEMFDNSVFPSAGMECQTSKGIITVKYVGKKVVVCENSNGDEYTTSKKSALHSFKPLTPPVPLITGKAYQFEHQSGDTVVGIYSESQQSFDNYGIKYYPWHCTNIQPLTLAK